MIYSMIFLLNSLVNKKVILSRLTYSLDNIASFVVYFRSASSTRKTRRAGECLHGIYSIKNLQMVASYND